MKYIINLLILFTCFIFLVACGTEDNEYDFYNQFKYTCDVPFEKDINNSINMTEDEMNEYFRTAYGWQNLKSHSLFWDEQERLLVMQFFFDNESALWQINSAQQYGLDTFVFKQMHNLIPQTYQMWSREQSIQHLFVETYVSDELCAQDYYRMEGYWVTEELHYETREILIEGQIYKPKEEKRLRKRMSKCLGTQINIVFRKDLREEDIIIEVTSERQIRPEKLGKLKEQLGDLKGSAQEVILELYDYSERLYYKERVW